MRIFHEASVKSVSHKYYEPKENNKGAIKGIMYEKIDKNTGNVKFKSGSNALEKLLMKVRGYTALQESSAKKFLNAMFPKAPISEDEILTTRRHKSGGKSSDVVSANYFHQIFENQKNAHEKKQASDLITAVNNLHGNSRDILR